MSFKLHTLPAALALCVLASPSFAAENDSGWYFGAQVGGSLLSDNDATATSPATPATPGPICGLLGLPSALQPLCNLLGGSSGTAGSQADVTTQFNMGPALLASVGYGFGNHLRPELSLGYFSNEVDTIVSNGASVSNASGKVTSLSLMANAWYDLLDPASRWRPYVGLGLGYSRLSEKGVGVPGGVFADGSAGAFAYQAGTGVGYAFSDKLTLSLDYRYLASGEVSIANPTVPAMPTTFKGRDHAFYAGVRYALGGKSAPAAPEKAPCRIDPQGVPPDALGADGCPKDADGDGIADYLDECPSTPAGASVLPNGCAPTGDCRRPRPGELVDEKGCALEGRMVLRGIKFEFDSDRLTPESKRILDGVAQSLNAYPDVKVQVEGHTDWLGSDAYNLALSERRAVTVRNYLMGLDVVGERMTPVGYGEAKPIADNNTEEGREENRRVEFLVVQ